MADPDEVCGLCGLTRENHGDAQHEFSLTGDLVPKKQPEPARQNPPRERGQQADRVDLSFLELIEVLMEKEIYFGGKMHKLLDAQDVMRILSAPARRQ